jgi:DNA-binding transcriptional MerR regulator
VRVAELSTATGVTVPTIKYYLREGLLPQGELTSPNQARYGEQHVRRLRLIRALIEVGGLSVARLREVLAALDEHDGEINNLLGTVQFNILPPGDEQADAAGIAEVDRLLERHGWHVSDKHPARQVLAGVITRARQLGMGWLLEVLDPYAVAAEEIAKVDIDLTARQGDREAMSEVVVVGTILGDAMLTALRHMAHEFTSARRFGAESFTDRS